MFGIPVDIEKEIALLPVRHSWAAFYLDGSDSWVVERELNKWIDEVTPNVTIAWIIKPVLFLYLEHEAIERFVFEHKNWGDSCDSVPPAFENAFEAAEYGKSQSFCYDADVEDTRAAASIMEEMYNGSITPFMKVRVPAQRISNPRAADLSNPFFKVGMRPLYWANCDIPSFDTFAPTRFFGIVDLETGTTYASVTSSYCLYTNREVYDLMLEIAGSVLGVIEKKSIMDSFEMSKNRGSCTMKVMRKEEVFQPLVNDGWQAVLEGVNSYDTSEPLRYTFGFQNQAYRIPVLLPKYTVSVQTNHIIPFERFKKSVLDATFANIDFSSIEKEFCRIINDLKQTKLADRDMLPLFCKYFGIRNKPKSESAQRELFKALLFVDEAIKRNVKEIGKNSYALLHVILDYLSNGSVRIFNCEKQLGEWVKQFLDATKNDNFSMANYIGAEAYDVASWYGTI